MGFILDHLCITNIDGPHANASFTSFDRQHSSEDNAKPKASFLNDLAAKMAAGPPKKPVGLLKKSNVAEKADEQAKADLQQSMDMQKKLGAILNDSVNSQPKEPPAASDTKLSPGATEKS